MTYKVFEIKIFLLNVAYISNSYCTVQIFEIRGPQNTYISKKKQNKQQQNQHRFLINHITFSILRICAKVNDQSNTVYRLLNLDIV